MTLTVRLPHQVEERLTQYCVNRGISKSEAVKGALEQMLDKPSAAKSLPDHPFLGADTRPGDVAKHTKRLLRERFRGK